MPSEQEFAYHRTFLSLHLCKTIYNEDERYQNTPGGPPGRQQKIANDPVYAYHVRSGPRYPQRAPGTIDRQYNADRIREDGPREPLVIIPKRDQQFSKVATEWELKNSVLCTGAGSFTPVVDKSMEVTGHSANIRPTTLIHPEGVFLKSPGEYIENDVPLFLWNYQIYDSIYGGMVSSSVPPGWQSFDSTSYTYKGQYTGGSRKQWNGGIEVVVLPNGKVVRAEGKEFQSNNGHAESSWSPLDFWSPGARWAAGAFRALTNRAAAASKAAYTALRGPTTEVAELAAARMASKTLTGMAGPTGALPLQHIGRRTIIMGEDMAKMSRAFSKSSVESGLYDVVIHGDDMGFYVLERTIPHPDPKKVKEIWREVSVRELAGIVRPRLAAGEQIRLLACKTGRHAGPAQQLANELERTVWASNESIWNMQGVFMRDKDGKVVRVVADGLKNDVKSFVPKNNGKFSSFVPQSHRGTAALVGNGPKVPGNVVKGQIVTKK